MSSPAVASPAERIERLARTWQTPSGLIGWFMPVNQRVIGRRFIITAFAFFVAAGILALLMRVQLARPGLGFLSEDTYNQFFTMHGTTMMFLFAVPVMEGFAIYVVPLMIGARDMAFPRLNAFGYYVYLIGGVSLWVALAFDLGPDTGWFAYVPLSDDQFSPSHRVGFWATVITFIEVSALVAAVELIVTILKLRAPGMSLNRMPLFVWAILVMSLMIVFAMPPLVVTSIMLALDRTFQTRFFDVALGGEPLLWQHLFWVFGHPEVYLIFIPALGMISSIIVAFIRRPIFGYTALVLSMVATGFIGFGLWVHHMYTTGLPLPARTFFTAASAMIAIPSGVQIFCWIASLWGSRPRFATPLLYVLGFFAIFVLGGLTGVMIASIPFDEQVHDTFFIVAHFHYVLIGGTVFPLIGGVYYWFPKISGRMLGERAGRWSFWLTFAGFNLTFFPMHQLGLQGMPRRVFTYLPGLGWDDMNLLATIGAAILAAGFGVTLANVLWSFRKGEQAPDNPWEADTLEWSTTSPPPTYNFIDPPAVTDRWALWAWRERNERPVVVGLRDDVREVLITSVLDAEPQAVQVLPGPSIWPFLMAASASAAFIGFNFNPWWVVAGFFAAFAATVGWLWPRNLDEPAAPEELS